MTARTAPRHRGTVAPGDTVTVAPAVGAGHRFGRVVTVLDTADGRTRVAVMFRDGRLMWHRSNDVATHLRAAELPR